MNTNAVGILKVKLAENAVELMEWIKETGKAGLETGAAFVKEQTPLLVQEYLKWTFWDAAVSAGVAAGIGILSILLVRKIIKSKKIEWDDEDQAIPAGVGVLIGCIITLIMGICTYNCTKTALKVAVAPRVVLVEMAKDLIPHNQGK